MLTPRYRYELRNGGTTLATGHLSRTEPLAEGDQIEIAGSIAYVRAITPLLDTHELRLVLEFQPTPKRAPEQA